MPAAIKLLARVSQFSDRQVSSVLAKWSDGLYYKVTHVLNTDIKARRCLVKFEDGVQCWMLASSVHMQLSDEFNENNPDLIVCCICDGEQSNPPNEIVLCDICQQGYHVQCHTADPIDRQQVRLGDEEKEWICATCNILTNPPSSPNGPATPEVMPSELAKMSTGGSKLAKKSTPAKKTPAKKMPAKRTPAKKTPAAKKKLPKKPAIQDEPNVSSENESNVASEIEPNAAGVIESNKSSENEASAGVVRHSEKVEKKEEPVEIIEPQEEKIEIEHISDGARIEQIELPLVKAAIAGALDETIIDNNNTILTNYFVSLIADQAEQQVDDTAANIAKSIAITSKGKTRKPLTKTEKKIPQAA